MVLTARRLRRVVVVVDDVVGVGFGEEEEVPTVTARTASETASSSREGSKKMLSLTAMTRRVMGGRVGKGFDDLASVLVLGGGW